MRDDRQHLNFITTHGLDDSGRYTKCSLYPRYPIILTPDAFLGYCLDGRWNEWDSTNLFKRFICMSIDITLVVDRFKYTRAWYNEFDISG